MSASVAPNSTLICVREKIAFGPDYAMYRLVWGTTYRTNREALWDFFRIAVVTFCLALQIIKYLFPTPLKLVF